MLAGWEKLTGKPRAAHDTPTNVVTKAIAT
jgi:hypothetical protein